MKPLETVEQDGVRYRLYAGPFADKIDAYDRIGALIDIGVLDEKADDPIVIGTSIYRRVREGEIVFARPSVTDLDRQMDELERLLLGEERLPT